MRVVYCGGGTLGHVVPLVAVAERSEEILEGEVESLFIGQKRGAEESYLSDMGFNFRGISCGKLRRYFSFQNFVDPFNVIKGVFDAFFILRKFSPDVVMAKGGYVSVPVVLSAAVLRIPIVIHESDVHLGLSNLLVGRFAKRICLSFANTSGLPEWAKDRVRVTGNPMKSAFLSASASKGRDLMGFKDEKPVLLVTGGSSGSAGMNRAILTNLDALTSFCNVYLLCGNGKKSDFKKGGFVECEFSDDIMDLMKASSLCVTRAGAGGLANVCALGVPSVVIPLDSAASDHQNKNAKALAEFGAFKICSESDMGKPEFVDLIKDLILDEKKLKDLSSCALEMSDTDGAIKVCNVIRDVV